MSKQKHPCQLYQYNAEEYLLTKNTTQYYAQNFASKELIEKEYKVNWLNFHSITDRENIDSLCQSLGIDKLTVEDLYRDLKRPKLEEYTEYLFFSINSALIKDPRTPVLNTERIAFILNERFLISFQEKSSDHFTEVRERIEKKKGKIRLKGPDFLLFRMLEAITDNYYEVLESISDSIESIEKKILLHPKSDTLKRIEQEKRKLVELRKIVFPLKDLTSQLDKTQSSFIARENHYYFSDLKDNCLSILEEIDANKQILEGMANLYYAVQGQRMNEIMKLLTVVSAIFIPLTFIVGVYGMNFSNMPETKTKYGYFISLGAMAMLALILLLYFKKRGWLNK